MFIIFSFMGFYVPKSNGPLVISISSPLRPERLWGPPTLLSNGYQRLFPWGVKRPGREADNSPPSSAEVKKAWSYTSTPQYVFMAWCLDNFTFTFIKNNIDLMQLSYFFIRQKNTWTTFAYFPPYIISETHIRCL
jgi:hypothetical protein